MSLEPPPDQDIVVVGASGDLAQRKLLPALYNLSREKLLPTRGAVIGTAPVDWGDQQFRDHAHQAVATFSRTSVDDAAFATFAERLHFVPLSGDDITPLQQHFTQQRRIVYLAVPPSAFSPLISAIGTAGIADDTSIIIEKPFGRDLDSARQLNAELHSVVPEERVFRIDHYLGKETVQNLLVFRFGNSVFDRVWTRDAISRVEITVAETLGVDGRGRLYEEIGAIRDIVQNHLFQVLALTAMEPPISFEPEAIRNEKVKVLRAIRPIDPEHVVRGQYTAGTVGKESAVAYRSEPGVSPDSTTETFAALRLQVESWRWTGVPFLLRTGKRLKVRDSRVVIVFRDVPLHLFREVGVEAMESNRLVVRIQPDEGIALSFSAKQPGPDVTAQDVHMNFNYGSSFRGSPPEAYERLLHDALHGDHMLFIREDEVEAGWSAVDGILKEPPPVEFYAAGSWGPKDAARIAAPGHWHAAENEV